MRTVVVALAIVVAAGCGGESQRAQPTASVAEAGGRIAGTTLAGDTVSLDQFRGRPVLVNVWSSWWLVCQGEAGAYAEFARDHPEVAFLGLNAADTPDRAHDFVRRYGWTWPSIVDPERRLAKRIGADYQPFVALFDERGRLVAAHDGAGDRRAWRALLGRLD